MVRNQAFAICPHRIIETGRWWADFQPGDRVGNLYNIHPVPKIVQQTDEAKALLIETRLAAEAEYRTAEARSTRWAPPSGVASARTSANSRWSTPSARTIANRRSAVRPSPGPATFVKHQTSRMLFMANQHVADGEFDAECLKVIRKLHSAPEGTLAHSMLLKRMKMESKRFQDLINTLVQRSDVEPLKSDTAGRPGMAYRLRVKREGERCS